eukprot:scaffold207840_cov28-Tisochrysis_lutea.AAC.5
MDERSRRVSGALDHPKTAIASSSLGASRIQLSYTSSRHFPSSRKSESLSRGVASRSNSNNTHSYSPLASSDHDALPLSETSSSANSRGAKRRNVSTNCSSEASCSRNDQKT